MDNSARNGTIKLKEHVMGASKEVAWPARQKNESHPGKWLHEGEARRPFRRQESTVRDLKNVMALRADER